MKIATRREFLEQGLGLVGVGALVPQFLVNTALAGPQARDGERILVVLQLSGGNDGLSTVVPYRDDDYARNRSATRQPAGSVLRIDDEVGLHPNLKGFQELLEQRALAVIQGVGYPNPNRSHFTSMDIWQLADNSGRPVRQGWLGRYCDRSFPAPRQPTLAVAVGSAEAPLALQGREYTGLSLQRPESFRSAADQSGNRRLGQTYRNLTGNASARDGASANYQFLARTAVAANASSEQILKLAQARRSGVTYPQGQGPQSQLTASLQTVAALIAGGLPARIYYVFQGGYDTHAGQKARHDQLMTQLGEAVAAFQKDLGQQGNSRRVLTMVFSEFGRRVRENFSQGTDHGAAAPMFLIGPAVKAGPHGKHPSLADADLDQGDLKHALDFRSVYATVLENWLGTPSQPILGDRFPLVNCLPRT